MLCVFRISQFAIGIGIATIYYGAFRHDFILFITGITLAWCGFGLMTSLLETQRLHQD